jgi:hypothetical protein
MSERAKRPQVAGQSGAGGVPGPAGSGGDARIDVAVRVGDGPALAV